MFLMLLLLLGVVFVLLHWAGIGPSANWPWWALLLPFGLAVLWWTWLDTSGRTRAQQDQKFQKRIEARRARAIESLGLNRGRRVKPPSGKR
jgi:small Trp-rich protein